MTALTSLAADSLVFLLLLLFLDLEEVFLHFLLLEDRLLVTEASLWVLDEPFTSLDRDSMALFSRLFEQHLQRDGLIVMTSHHEISLPTQTVQRLRLGEAA